jgi:hypothetical protein
MLQLAGLGHNQTIPYDEAVVEGKTIVGGIHRNQWRLGELANFIEPKYGEGTLAKFAEEIGVRYTTLKNCRSVFRAWPELDFRKSISFSVANMLRAHPDREAILRDNPLITVARAYELAKEYRAGLNGDDEADDEDNAGDSSHRMDGCDAPTDDDSVEDRWRYNFSNMAQLSIELRAHWDKHFKGWDFLDITTEEIKLADDAAREWRAIAKGMKGMKNG